MTGPENPKRSISPRLRTTLLILAALAVLAVCLATAFGIRGMVLRLQSGGSLFTFPPAESPPDATATGVLLPGAVIAVTPGAAGISTPEASATVPPVSLEDHPCYNPLVPLLPGASWIYQVRARGDLYRLRLSAPPPDASPAGFDLTALPAGFTVHSTLDCEQGSWLNLPLAESTNRPQDSLKGRLITENVSGELLPGMDELSSWSGSALLTGSATLRYERRDYSFTMDQATLTFQCQSGGSGAAAQESVTVPAGRFEAIRVSCSLQAPATVGLNTWKVSGTVRAEFIAWFSPTRGLVKLQPVSVYVTSPLVSFPVSVSGSGVELTAYTPGE